MARAKKPEEPIVPINTYGMRDIPGYTQLHYDRGAFLYKISVDQGAPRRIDLFKRISDKFLPGHFEWHEWTERIIGSMCEHKASAFPGAAGSSKTFNLASFAVCWWLVDPGSSSVMLISTTKAALRQRAWSEVTKCLTAIPGPRIGNFVDSRMMWQSKKGDDRHAIFGRAVEEGPLHKVVDNIKGVHTKRQLVIIDEATAVPAAIYSALSNMYGYPSEFLVAFAGNPYVRFDQFGRVCEPEGGWNSVTVETEEWMGKPMDEIGGIQAHVVRLDAEKSPNIMQGRMVSKHLPTKEMVERSRETSGGGNSPLYFQNFRGFWPPEGITKTVLSQSILDKNDAFGVLEFTGLEFKIIGFLDPAFTTGGDRPILQLAKMGEVEVGPGQFKIGIQALPPIELKINAHLKNVPVSYQLLNQAKAHCQTIKMGEVEYECLPENFGLDVTGTGMGTGDVFQQEWSFNVNRVDFGGGASTDQTSLEDTRPANEAYENKRCEMAHRLRNAVETGQFKGISKQAAHELCNIQVIDMREDGTTKKRVVLQSKKSYRETFKSSPDHADATTGLIEIARKRGFKLSTVGQTAIKAETFSKQAKVAAEVYSESGSFVEEELEYMEPMM